MTWDIRIGTGVDLSAFRDLVARSLVASYLQDPDWPQYAPRKARHDYLHVTVGRPGEPLLLAGVLRRSRLPGGLSLGSFRRGPLTAAPSDLALALPPLIARLRRMGLLTLTLNPRWTDEAIAPAAAALRRIGAREVPFDRQTLHQETAVIDLDADLETIRSRFQSNIRTKLRKAARAGVATLPLTDPAAVADFDRWLRDLAGRTGYDTSGLPDAAAQVAHARACGGVAGEVHLDGTRVGVFIGLRDADRLLFTAPGWSETSTNLPRLPIVIDALIAEGLRIPGVTAVDLGGVMPADRRGADSAADNRERGKHQLNPRIIRLLPMHEVSVVPGAAAAMGLARRLRS